MGLLEGKVIAITGAGAGIGKEHALLAAKEGARVVVNDLGGSRDGSGASDKVADQVVEEIKAAGGDAVGHYQDISETEGGNALIKAGIDKWGRFDALINNAGILRDKMSFNMTDDEWDICVKVHLRGHFVCARAACQHFRAAVKSGDMEAGSGAIVNTTSTSGLLGNAGQANYGAAKLGIVGMTNTMAIEMAKYAHINSVAPMALTRLTEDLAIAGAIKEMTPAKISPLCIFLASDAAMGINGQVFGVYGKIIQLWRLPRPIHYYESAGDIWDPNDVAKLSDEMKQIISKVNQPYMPGMPGPKFEL